MANCDHLRERVARLKAGLERAIEIAHDAAEATQACGTLEDQVEALTNAVEQIAALGSIYDDDLI